MAVTEIGVDWRFSSTRRAVTTMSASWLLLFAVVSAGRVLSWSSACAGTARNTPIAVASSKALDRLIVSCSFIAPISLRTTT